MRKHSNGKESPACTSTACVRSGELRLAALAASVGPTYWMKASLTFALGQYCEARHDGDSEVTVHQ
jgi:hypothetical protein